MLPCGAGPGVDPARHRYVAQVQPLVDRHMAALRGEGGVWCAHLRDVPGTAAFAYARCPGAISCFGCLPVLRDLAGEAGRCDVCGVPAAPDRPVLGVMVPAGPTHILVERCGGCRRVGTGGVG